MTDSIKKNVLTKAFVLIAVSQACLILAAQ